MAETWREMMEYVGFDEEDARRLLALRPLAEAHLQPIVDHFYAAILGNSGARGVLKSEEQVDRLKITLKTWICQLLEGPHDEAYWERRLRIGRTHVRVGLPDRYVFGAMNLLRNDLIQVAFNHLPAAEAHDCCISISRITDVELAVINQAYVEAHEEKELRSLQDLIVRNMPVTILCLDDEGRVTAATRPSARLFSQHRGENLSGVHYRDYLPPDFIEASDLEALIDRALAVHREVSAPRVVVGREPMARRFHVSVIPLDHELVRVLVHVEDLTDALRAETRLQQAEALARVGALAANVAHEIRNPLTAISTTLQVISGSLNSDDPRRRILDKVKEQVQRLDRLVTDLLSYARPVRPVLQPVDLDAAIRDALLASGVRAAIRREEDTPVRADPHMIQQILLNLLINARDAAGDDGTIQIHAGPGPMLRVQDDGPGIEEHVASQIFEPFITTKAKGTGLGLAISRKLAESMGGSLRLEAGYSEGASFCLTLIPVGVGRDAS